MYLNWKHLCYNITEEVLWMANIIAIVWDFDKTLIDGYMEDPILIDNGIDPKTFWAEVNALPGKYEKRTGNKGKP